MNTISSCSPVVDGCIEVCRRCLNFLPYLTPAQYAGSNGVSGIGPHMRHCLDHYSCLLDGIDTGEVDYDARERNPEIEHDPDQFRRALDVIIQSLAQLDNEALRRRVRVRQMAASFQEPVVVESSVERELLFLSGHTIHHIATATQLARQHGVTIPTELSVAFSTAAHDAQHSAAE